jgi:hypothetical protein
VFGECIRICVGQLIQQPRGALDIREEKGHCPARKLRHDQV